MTFDCTLIWSVFPFYSLAAHARTLTSHRHDENVSLLTMLDIQHSVLSWAEKFQTILGSTTLHDVVPRLFTWIQKHTVIQYYPCCIIFKYHGSKFMFIKIHEYSETFFESIGYGKNKVSMFGITIYLLSVTLLPYNSEGYCRYVQ